MSEQKHKEPWHFDDEDFYIVDAEDGIVCEVGGLDVYPEDEANAERIIQCVNACAGIPDPAAAIKEAREALTEVLARGATAAALAKCSSALAALTPKEKT